MAVLDLASQRATFSRSSERSVAHVRFFGGVLQELAKVKPGLADAAPPSGANWLAIRYLSNGHQKLSYLGFAFLNRNRFRVELYLDDSEAHHNKQVFDQLQSQRPMIDAALGEVSWERLEDRRPSRIAVYHKGSITSNEQELKSLQAWAVKTMINLHNIISTLADQNIAVLSGT